MLNNVRLQELSLLPPFGIGDMAPVWFMAGIMEPICAFTSAKSWSLMLLPNEAAVEFEWQLQQLLLSMVVMLVLNFTLEVSQLFE